MNELNKLGYVVVTDYIEANTGKDVSDALQKLILDNPHRTIYFPDGEYIIAKPICTPANPANAVHLVLSNFATIKASDDWSSFMMRAISELASRNAWRQHFAWRRRMRGSSYHSSSRIQRTQQCTEARLDWRF